jgi:hypothetical protein
MYLSKVTNQQNVSYFKQLVQFVYVITAHHQENVCNYAVMPELLTITHGTIDNSARSFGTELDFRPESGRNIVIPSQFLPNSGRNPPKVSYKLYTCYEYLTTIINALKLLIVV